MESRTVPSWCLIGFVAWILCLPVFAQQDTIKSGKFTRGSGTNEDGHSFAIGLDFQKGRVCGDIGGATDTLLPYIPSSPYRYHFNQTNASSLTNISLRIPFRNPIVSFGSRVGGSPLYVGQRYRFGGYGGEFISTPALVIYCWTKNGTNMTYLGAQYVDIPDSFFTPSTWLPYQTNGYSMTVSSNGLTTVIALQDSDETQGLQSQWGVFRRGTCILTHTADGTATNKVYQIGLTAYINIWPSVPNYYAMVALGNGGLTDSILYTVEFENRPTSRSVFVDQTQFAGEPLPPAYAGKTAEELLTNNAVTTSFTLAQGATTYTNLDHSPELRRHPTLDQFVKDMRQDPIALTRYVQNEIETTDALGFNENGSLTDLSINQGGVARGALATYLEGRGAPAEQCALLVYLLRQSGVPAVYVYPYHNTMKLLDKQVNGLLRMQVSKAVNAVMNPYTTNRAIPANYPWVAAYIGGAWVHLFPWLKDREVIEGLNLYDYMSPAYDNGFKWMRNYILGDTNILAYVKNDDTMLGIYDRFLQGELQKNAPGLSLDDIGYSWRDRRNAYVRWSDFPHPWVTPTNAVAVDTLSSSGLTNVSPSLSKIFDTLTVDVSSVNNPTKKISSGELRLVDLHNRRLVVRHEKTGANAHNMILSLAPFKPGATGPTNFLNGDALLNSQQTNTALNSTDDKLNIRITCKRHRGWWDGTGASYPNADTVFPSLGESAGDVSDYPLRKGDLATICLNYGVVSRAMLNVHAKEIWAMERLLTVTPSATNTLSPDVYQGGLAFMTGMSYYERLSRLRDRLTRLHKFTGLTYFDASVVSLTAKHVSGVLPNSGDIILTKPVVDVRLHRVVLAGNQTIHPDSGIDSNTGSGDWLVLHLAGASSEEHHAINAFFAQTDAVSTVRLLQLAQKRSSGSVPGVQTLNAANYQAYASSNFNGTTLQNHDPVLWASVSAFFQNPVNKDFRVGFITPGSITNTSNTYLGVGALLWTPGGDLSALITGGVNGGYSPALPDTTFDLGNAQNISLNVAPGGDFYADFAPPSSSNKEQAPQNVTDYDTASVVNNAAQGYYSTNPVEDEAAIATMTVYGITGSGSSSQQYGQALQTSEDRGLLSTFLSVADRAWSTVADPVDVVSGEFWVHQVDLNLPGPMPLELKRNYSSLNEANNQFGYGWKFNFMPYLGLSTNETTIYAADPDGSVLAFSQVTNNLWAVKPEKNPLLDNRSISGMGSTANDFNSKITRTNIAGNSVYTLSKPDGSVRTYQTGLISGDTSFKPYLTRWQDDRGNFFTFEYGTDATQVDYKELRRIQSSSGNYLIFSYDVFGHVIEALTGDGRRFVYVYDEHGDLTRVTLPDSSEWVYEYEHKTLSITNGSVVTQAPYSTHVLLQETKPEGRLLVNQYDSYRRVTNQFSTASNTLALVRTASFSYSTSQSLSSALTNSPSGTTVITDVYNNKTLYAYTNGLITLISNAVGGILVQDWYLTNEASLVGYYPRSLQRIIDKRGLVTDYRYDSNGNLTNTTVTGNLTGSGTTNETAVTTMSYTNNLLWEVIDPVGNRLRRVYDTNYPFQVQQVVRVSGTTPVSTNLFLRENITNTFTLGGVNYTNSANGVVKQEVRAYGTPDAATHAWSNDGRGFPLVSTRYTGTGDSNVTAAFVYNGRGEMVQSVDAVNRTNRFDYDGLGRLKWHEVVSETGVPVSWDYSYYNASGDLTWTDGSRYNPEDYVWRDYDGAGRLTTVIRWRSRAKTDGSGVEAVPGYDLWATTFHEFDAFGNLKRSIDPRGVVVTNSWDAIGRLTQRVVRETNGSVLTSELFNYDLDDRVHFHTNGLGGIDETRYTTSGKKSYFRSADGATNGWLYYLDGRLRREVLRNGSYWESVYDDLNRTTTQVLYSAANSPLATNQIGFDRRGNVVRRTDAGGNVWTNLFDGLDRIRIAAGPVMTNTYPTNAQPPSLPGYTPLKVQQVTTHYYDAAGAVTATVNGLGEQTVIYYDALARPTRTEIRSPSNVLVRETSIAYSPDHHGVTVTEGSGGSAVVSDVFTDNDGNTVLRAGHSATSTLEFTRTERDAVGNALFEGRYSSTNGTLVSFSTSTNSFDGLNRVLKRVDRDNAVTSFAYDALGNLTSRTMPGGSLAWTATYDSAGRVLTEQDAGTGGVTSRKVGYAYYGTNASSAGLLQWTTNGNGVTCQTSYDPWLRETSKAYSHPSGIPQYAMTTTLSYDNRSLLTGVAESFANGTTGPSTTVTNRYDAYGSRIRQQVFVGTNQLSAADATWDSAERRKGLSFGLFGVGYTWAADGRLVSANGVTGGGAYTYNTAGNLTSRVIGQRTTTYSQRDGMGRVLSASTVVSGSSALNETLTWTGDGLLASHLLDRSDYTDQRKYSYASQSRRLIDERLGLASGTTWTNTFIFDAGQASGPGVLTRTGDASTSGLAWKGNTDGLSRVNVETNSVSRKPAYGGVKGQGTIVVTLDGRPMPVSLIGTKSPQWRTSLELVPGTHQLVAKAIHSSGLYTASSTTTFTNAATENVAVSYDAAGQITNRLWKSGSATNRSQALLWDGRGRLWKVSERDDKKSGFDWVAVYDGLGRRLTTTTTTIIVTNSVTNISAPRIISQYYDPEHRFLEIGVTESGKTTWKLMGPDLNGVYGGMEGTGGFDAFVPSLELFCPLVADVQGNIHAIYVTHATLSWYPTRVTGYGAPPGYRPPPLSHGADLAGSSSWRGKWSDITGLTYLGNRYYDSVEGRFLSGDPMGHAGSADLYSFCNGDPVNYFDPDGRFGKQAFNYTYNGGLGGQELSQLGNYLNNYQTDNSALAALTGFGGSLSSSLGGMVTPANYVNSAVNFGSTVNTLYHEDGAVVAGSYALTSWNVGAIWEGSANIDLATGQPVGDGFERAQRIISGTANTAGLALGGARLMTASGITAPAENFAARTYLNMVDRPGYYSSMTEGTARLNIEFGRDLFRAANSDGAANFGEFASVERPASAADAISGNALDPAITPNQATQLYKVQTRFGFSVEGTVAPQGPGYPGGFRQVIQVRPGEGVSPWRNVQQIGYGTGGKP